MSDVDMDSDVTVTKLKEIESYNTWPDRSKLSSEPGTVDGSDRIGSVSAVNNMTVPMTMEAALEQLNISYSPVSQCLAESTTGKPHPETEQPEQQQQGNVVYKPGHRKAYSLPRTLESVDDAGSITGTKVEHDVMVESPRTTLQRYGIAYEPYNFRPGGEDTVSSVSGVSGGVSDLSSHGDSGVFSEVSDKSKAVRKGLGELFSKATSFRLFSKTSSQQQDVRRRDSECPSSSSAGAVSSQSLIMEARPPGVPSKNAEEEEKHKQVLKIIINFQKPSTLKYIWCKGFFDQKLS